MEQTLQPKLRWSWLRRADLGSILGNLAEVVCGVLAGSHPHTSFPQSS